MAEAAAGHMVIAYLRDQIGAQRHPAASSFDKLRMRFILLFSLEMPEKLMPHAELVEARRTDLQPIQTIAT